MKALVDRSGHTDRPALHHRVFFRLAIEFDRQERLVNGVLSLGRNLLDGTSGTRWHEDSVFVQQTVLNDLAPDITSANVISLFHGRSEWPLLLAVQGRDSNTTGNVDTIGFASDGL